MICDVKNLTKFRVEKVINRKLINFMLNGKAIIIPYCNNS